LVHLMLGNEDEAGRHSPWQLPMPIPGFGVVSGEVAVRPAERVDSALRS
jgi:hypothetical protein